jgi:hypothetical protein
MKVSKNTILSFALLILVASLYRIIPVRPAGFAPQMALALFGGAMISDKKWALSLPLLSLFLSDFFYQVLYAFGFTSTPGFYEGQLIVYGCFLLITIFSFLMKKVDFKNITLFSISGSLIFFIATNFLVWIGGGGFNRPKTFEGLMMCYADALAFYRDGGLIHGFAGNFILGDLIFTAILFGGYFIAQRSFTTAKA